MNFVKIPKILLLTIPILLKKGKEKILLEEMRDIIFYFLKLLMKFHIPKDKKIDNKNRHRIKIVVKVFWLIKVISTRIAYMRKKKA